MKQKDLLKILTLSILLMGIGCLPQALAQTTDEGTNPILRFLRNVDYTTRVWLQHDDNIFLTQTGKDEDFKQIFSQAFEYNHSKDNHFFRGFYIGNYEYFNQESLGTLSHRANALYSYRPFSNFSFSLGNNFYWLSDSSVSAPLADRLLAVGYTQIDPFFEIKYEIVPRLTLQANLNFTDLDVRSDVNDDFIDHERLRAVGQLIYGFDDRSNYLGFVGFEHDQIAFSQTFEKSAVSARPFVGFTKKLPGILNLTYEAGFENIDMDDNADDDNIDHTVSLETVFSVFTKLRMSYIFNSKNPSIRRDYTQYGASIASLALDHTINPKTSVVLRYSYETQDFNSADALIGQPIVDRETYIQNLGLGFNRKLNQWLTFNLDYGYTKRDSDFALESYRSNRYSAGLTARY